MKSGTAVLDAEGRVLRINPELADWLGFPNATGLRFRDLVPPGLAGPALENFLESSDEFAVLNLHGHVGASPGSFELERTLCGETQHLRLCNVIPGEGAFADSHWNFSLQDEVAVRALVTRMLRAEAQLKALADRWPGVIFSQRVDFSFNFVSPQIEALTGVSAEEWRRSSDCFWQVVHEGDVVDLQRQIREMNSGSSSLTTSYRIRHLGTGRICYIQEHREAIISANGLVLGYEGVWLDITRQAIAEKRLSAASWKETLAIITMGLAHDFSNIMAGIHSLSDAYLSQIGPEDPFREGFGLIKRNSLQASQLVKRILSLHQGKVGERNYHNLNDLVSDTLEVLTKILPARVRIENRLAPEQLPLYLDAVEFRQMLINMGLNAADAMPQGGVLTLETSRYESYPQIGFVEGTLPKLPAICLTVRDTGTGIPPRLLSSIFDPFFTTKAINKGSGLGLYNARLFVEKHGGAISVETSDNRGTAFHVWLPQATFSEDERRLPEARSRRPALLFVELGDENVEQGANFLRHRGYYVASANSQATALEFLNSPDYPFDALLLQVPEDRDLVLRIANEARQRKPPIRMILRYTGVPDDTFCSQLGQQAELLIPAETPLVEVAGRLDTLLKNGGVA